MTKTGIHLLPKNRSSSAKSSVPRSIGQGADDQISVVRVNASTHATFGARFVVHPPGWSRAAWNESRELQTTHPTLNRPVRDKVEFNALAPMQVGWCVLSEAVVSTACWLALSTRASRNRVCELRLGISKSATPWAP